MKKTAFSFLLVLLSFAGYSQGVIDTFKLDYKNSLGQKVKTLMATQAVIYPVYGISGADTALKVRGTSKIINDEIYIVDAFGHYVKSVKPDSSKLATKFELASKLDTTAKIATKTDLKNVVPDTLNKIATKTDLKNVVPDTLTKIATKTDVRNAKPDTLNLIATKKDIAGVTNAVVLDTSAFVNRSMNLSDVPDKAAARANLGITGTGGGSGSYDTLAAYDVAPVAAGKNFYLDRTKHKLGVLLGGKWLYFSASDSVALAAAVNQNLLLFSEQFENAAWSKVGGGTVAANTIAAPDGTTTADTYTSGVGAYGGLLRQNFIYSNGTYVGSVYVKKNNWNYVGLRVGAASGGGSELWGTNTPFVDLNDLGVYPAGNNVTIHATGTVGGWIRLDVSFTIVAANGTQDFFDICLVDGDGEISTARAGTEKVYVWGADLNTGSLKNYSKTTTTANP